MLLEDALPCSELRVGVQAGMALLPDFGGSPSLEMLQEPLTLEERTKAMFCSSSCPGALPGVSEFQSH